MWIEHGVDRAATPGWGAGIAPSADPFLIDTLAIRNGRNPLKIKESDKV